MCCGETFLRDLDELVHQLAVDVQAARGVDEDHVAALLGRRLDAPLRDLDRVGVGAALEDGHADLLAERAQLVDRRGPVDVARDERGRLALRLQPARELARERRLARALQAAQEDHGRRLRGERQRRAGAAEQLGQLLVDDLDDLLARRQALEHVAADRALAHRGDERADDLEVDVRLEQREADLAHGGVEILLGQRAALAQLAERGLEFVGEVVEHRGRQSPGPAGP